MPPTNAVPKCCCPRTQKTSFRDNVTLMLFSLIIFIPNPHHPPSDSAFHCCLKPLLIVEHTFCQLWQLHSGPQPPISINVPHTFICVHSKPVTLFALNYGATSTCTVKGMMPTKHTHHHPWSGGGVDALALGILMPHAMVGAKAAWCHGHG
jgi:hypothetical protein